jgi:hypothetical protein
VTGVTTWSGGVMTGPGRTVALGGLTLDGYQVTLDGRTFDNAGAAVWNTANNYSYLYLANNAVFNNLAGASFTDQRDDAGFTASIYGDGSANQINNLGAFVKNSNSDLDLSVAFNNTGAVNVQSGKLGLQDGSNDNLVTIEGGATVDINGIFVNQASGQIDGTGTLDILGATFTNNGTIAPTVTIVN